MEPGIIDSQSISLLSEATLGAEGVSVTAKGRPLAGESEKVAV